MEILSTSLFENWRAYCLHQVKIFLSKKMSTETNIRKRSPPPPLKVKWSFSYNEMIMRLYNCDKTELININLKQRCFKSFDLLSDCVCHVNKSIFGRINK